MRKIVWTVRLTAARLSFPKNFDLLFLASDAKWTIKRNIREESGIQTVMILSHSKPSNMQLQFIAGGDERKLKK